jgi:hypothetical protein
MLENTFKTETKLIGAYPVRMTPIKSSGPIRDDVSGLSKTHLKFLVRMTNPSPDLQHWRISPYNAAELLLHRLL